MESNQAFEQSAFYAAIKSLLVKKGYLSSTEAEGPEEWSLVHNASWNAYAANVLSLPGHLVPWNYESIPLALLEDADFVMEGAPDLSAIEGEVVASNQTAPAANPDDLEEDTSAGDTANSNGTTGTSFRIDDGTEETKPIPPVETVPTPTPAPTEPTDSGAEPTTPAEGNHVEGGSGSESDEEDETK